MDKEFFNNAAVGAADASFALKEGKEVELLDVSRFFVRVDWGQL
jgi:hypothetical protein